MSVAIVDYGSGNLHSAHKAFERAAREAGLDRDVKVTSDPDDVARAEHIVLPGVGAFADCRRGLDAVPGMVEALEGRGAPPRPAVPRHLRRHAVDGDARPRVRGRRRPRLDQRRRRPIREAARTEDPAHGLEHAASSARHPLLAGIATGDGGLHAYFVHSFQLYPANPADVVAVADYGGPVTAMVGRDNVVGTQFHPEKSQKLGLALIANFLRWRP